MLNRLDLMLLFLETFPRRTHLLLHYHHPNFGGEGHGCILCSSIVIVIATAPAQLLVHFLKRIFLPSGKHVDNGELLAHLLKDDVYLVLFGVLLMVRIAVIFHGCLPLYHSLCPFVLLLHLLVGVLFLLVLAGQGDG